ncbi:MULTISPECIES: hypothetical protein [Haloferax]|uniref:Twin-arginine translocation signal domain-containing protein n=2 Tax=Haloferax TaxID=2251 RepID=A0A6G1Z367_9EURY|nr:MULTISPECIES: hypothetical protein [Haloferax]KAB1188198.1 hypothetical protein Hfx1149_09205 [Haloferax sp. CBA1149]MRW80878.1 hypothetical protein [Haloferax marinisediminis]
MTNETQNSRPTRRRFLRTSGLVVGGLALGVGATGTAAARVEVANGWYEGEEIYYIAKGVEKGVTERGENDIFLIGGDREWQAQVVEFIPGESGYSPHWNVNLVKTAPGKYVTDIANSPYVSAHYPEALFDDVEDIRDAEVAGLVTITKPGTVVLCPIVPERVADAPGTTELPEDFPRPWPNTF